MLNQYSAVTAARCLVLIFTPTGFVLLGQNDVLILCLAGVFSVLYVYLFPEFRMQPYNSKSRKQNTIYVYMDTKGRMYRHLHSTNKTKKCI